MQLSPTKPLPSSLLLLLPHPAPQSLGLLSAHLQSPPFVLRPLPFSLLLPISSSSFFSSFIPPRCTVQRLWHPLTNPEPLHALPDRSCLIPSYKIPLLFPFSLSSSPSKPDANRLPFPLFSCSFLWYTSFPLLPLTRVRGEDEFPLGPDSLPLCSLSSFRFASWCCDRFPSLARPLDLAPFRSVLFFLPRRSVLRFRFLCSFACV
jgi:hypothetical protein